MIFHDKIINEKLIVNKDSFELLKISDGEYFGKDFKDYISNSYCKFICPEEGGNPFEYKYGNHDFISQNLDFGSIVHRDILENEKSEIIVGSIPTTDKMNKILIESAELQKKTGCKFDENIDFLIDKYEYRNRKTFEKNVLKFRKYYQYLLDDKRDCYFLSESSFDVLNKCYSSIDYIKEYLNSQAGEHHYEEAILGSFTYKNDYKDNKGNSTILKVKAKIDNFIIDHESKIITLNDLKTTASSINDFMGSSFNKFHYSRQFAFYLYLLNNLLQLDDYRLKANVIVLSKLDGKFEIFPIKQNIIENGYREFEDCLKRIGFHETYGYNVLRESI